MRLPAKFGVVRPAQPRLSRTGTLGPASLGLLCLSVLLCLIWLIPGQADAAVVPVILKARQATVKVASGIKMRAWTFNGTVPAPEIRATEGDTIQVTLINADRGTPARTV